MNVKVLQKSLLELIRRTSAELPGDVVKALQTGQRREKKGSTAKYALEVILDNIALAKGKSQPLCQDTATIICYAELPSWIDEKTFRTTYEKAVVEATKLGFLRQNSVDSITGKNSGNNLGPGSPSYHLCSTKAKTLTVRMMLKGGGSENMSRQYALPDATIGAGRDLACWIRSSRPRARGAVPGSWASVSGGTAVPGSWPPRSSSSGAWTTQTAMFVWPASKRKSCGRPTT